VSADEHDMEGRTPFDRLVRVIGRLREPGGCPWDREQTPRSLVPFVIEEAYEVVEAIEEGDPDALREELGDLLLQVLLQARIQEEAGHFDVQAVAEGLERKLVARHPHVFGEAVARTASEVANRWETIKAEEKKRKGDTRGVLEGVPRTLPALLKAQRLTEKAGRVGFDWPTVTEVLAKLREEVAELEEDILAGRKDQAAEELGDVLFVMANCARHLGIDAEAALQVANAKFARRFAHVEARLRQRGKLPSESTLEEMDTLWDEAKRLE
jgi:tetrapyrrole methylase family protein/MazG family protein/ATP diphosphatase